MPFYYTLSPSFIIDHVTQEAVYQFDKLGRKGVFIQLKANSAVTLKSRKIQIRKLVFFKQTKYNMDISLFGGAPHV